MPDIVCLRHYECPMQRLKWFNKNTLQKKKKKNLKMLHLVCYAIFILKTQFSMAEREEDNECSTQINIYFTSCYSVQSYNKRIMMMR